MLYDDEEWVDEEDDYETQEKTDMDIENFAGITVADVKFDRDASLMDKEVFEALAAAYEKLSPQEIINRLKIND